MLFCVALAETAQARGSAARSAASVKWHYASKCKPFALLHSLRLKDPVQVYNACKCRFTPVILGILYSAVHSVHTAKLTNTMAS